MLVAEEYLNPGQAMSQATLNTPVDTPLPSTPTQKFFPSSMPPPEMEKRSSEKKFNEFADMCADMKAPTIPPNVVPKVPKKVKHAKP